MRRLVTDTLVVAERNLVRLPRAPDLLLAFTVQPIMFVLLFVYVFGGAISTPGYDYVDFLIPGIIVQNIAFGGFVTALGLNEDLHAALHRHEQPASVVDGGRAHAERFEQHPRVLEPPRVADLGLRRPTLDDVFLSLTGHVAEAATDQDEDEDEEKAA